MTWHHPLPPFLSGWAGDVLSAGAARIIYYDAVRRLLVKLVDSRLRADLTTAPRLPQPGSALGSEHRLMALAALHTVDRLVDQRTLSPAVARVLIKRWSRALYLAFSSASPSLVRQFRDEHQCGPPWFVTISPGSACNLRCQGCYADSTPYGTAKNARMPWSLLDRVMTEAQELWDAGLFVFSGGEPLLYRSQGRGLLDAVEKHSKCLYLMFTNGTLIDEAVSRRLAQLGNVTPAISVEGMRARTEERRGNGVFDQVLGAMARLREAGVPFGISVTVTRDNAEEVLSDTFLDFFFQEQGAFYGFLFHYMPIGRQQCAGLAQVPTPRQRLQLWRRTWEVIEAKHIFLFDFWNSGPLVQGCLSAGRERGHLYVDSRGKVMPCVFTPYAAADLHRVYAEGGTLQDVWETPFLRTIRQWQRDHGYGQDKPSAARNWLRPCPIRDHYSLFRQWVEHHQPEPENEAAKEALTDEVYRCEMTAYGRELKALSQSVWEDEYLGS